MSGNRMLMWVLAAVALSAAPAQAASEQLKGSRFIEAMQDNTLSGTTEAAPHITSISCRAER